MESDSGIIEGKNFFLVNLANYWEFYTKARYFNNDTNAKLTKAMIILRKIAHAM